jgi:hypothetical protein
MRSGLCSDIVQTQFVFGQRLNGRRGLQIEIETNLTVCSPGFTTSDHSRAERRQTNAECYLVSQQQQLTLAELCRSQEDRFEWRQRRGTQEP